jgi:hypothetical protein
MSKEKKIIKTEQDLQDILKKVHVNGNYLRLSDHQFDCDVQLTGMLQVHLHDCIFNGYFALRGEIATDVIFKNVEFNKQADFSNYRFLRNVRFHGCAFNEVVKFNNTKFEALADFFGSTFKKNTIFYKTDFLDRTVFSATTFNANALFTFSLIKDHLILRGATFNAGLDLSLCIFSGSINVFNIKVSNYEAIADIGDEFDYEKAISEDGNIPHKNKRETFRILKKELQNQGNTIDALTMAALEKIAYQEQLKSDAIVKKGKWSRRSQNRFILFLGKISNSHGESWTIGVAFTLLVGLLFFYLLLISTETYYFTLNPENFAWQSFLTNSNYYFEFLLPTHDVDFVDTLKPEYFFAFWDFMGRIFVSFGIYQTVVAFRKFHSK